MRIRSLPLLVISLWVPAMLLLTACGTLEITIETQGSLQPGGTPTFTAPAPRETETLGPGPVTPTPTPWDYTPPIPETAFTPMPASAFQAPDGLRIASVKEGDIWLWSAEDRHAARLTTTGDVDGDVRISDDGQLVAFRRAGELWMVGADGSSEQLLVRSAELGEMGLEGGGAGLYRFQWVPGGHILAFNTRRDIPVGLVLNDDLHLVDADTLTRTVLLPPGEGGEFYYSPDGSQIALVTPSRISLIDADGQNRRNEILTHTPVATRSEFQYYAQPVWAADGGALRVAIPPADPLAQSVQPVTIWHIPTDGNPAWLVESTSTLSSLGPDIRFSSDLGYIAYIGLRGPEGAPPEQTEAWLELESLESESHIYYPDIGTVFGWAPGSLRFAFLAGRESPQLQIGQWSGRTFPGSVDAGTPIAGLDWVDADHYVVQVRRDWTMGAEGDSFELLLSDMTGASTVVESSPDWIGYDLVVVDQPPAE
jgi:hypothetical protein